jgi:hypothetical protein
MGVFACEASCLGLAPKSSILNTKTKTTNQQQQQQQQQQ